VNEEEKLLLLSPPDLKGKWGVISGALEAEETILEAVLRETREELGPDIRVRPLGTVHAYTFRCDDNIQYMIDLCYLMAYEGGQVQPGDDMRGSKFRWWSLEELEDESIQIIVPRGQRWLMGRAVELYRLWKDQEVDLQPGQER
jgi:ADP-ribose pyrophosphatase YjhB (NUDIX family)